MVNVSRNSCRIFDRPGNNWEKLPSVFCMTKYVSQTIQAVKFCFIPVPLNTQSFASPVVLTSLCCSRKIKCKNYARNVSHILYSHYPLSMLGRHKSKPAKCSCLDPLGTALIVDTTWTGWTVLQSTIKENVRYSTTTILYHFFHACAKM